MSTDGTFHCLFCGGALVWQNDWMASEVGFDYEEDDSAIATYYVCSHCGRSYEIVDPCEEERKDRYSDYWEDKREE